MRKLTIVLLVVLALAVAADLVARNVAESRLAEEIDSHEGVAGTEVDIHGFSFLLQAANSEFGEVDVSFPTLRGSAGAVGLDMQVDDVSLSLHDLTTSETFTRAVAQQVEGTGTVSYDEINRRLGIADVRFDEDTGGVVFSLKRTSFEAVLEPSVSDGNLQLFGDSARLPAVVRGALDQAINLTGIPDDVRITGVKATEAGLRVSLEAEDVPFIR